MAVRVGGAFSSAFMILFGAIWIGSTMNIPAPMNVFFMLVGLLVMIMGVKTLINTFRRNRGMAQDARRLTDEASTQAGVPRQGRFCPYCGTEVKPDYTHCPVCGSRLEP